MASGKLSPRQKMINMMYLVLMALLALNVSREILKTFHLMEVSFNKSKENTEAQIAVTLTSLEEKVKNKPNMQPYLDNALEAKKLGDDFVSWIQELKDEIEEGADGRNDENENAPHPYYNELSAPDNMEGHANLFMVKDRGKVGIEIVDRINNTRTAMVALVKEHFPERVEELETGSALRAEMTDEDKKKYPGENGWAKKYLEHSPAGGVMALLTKIQTDARATQLAVTELMAGGEKAAIIVRELVPVVRTSTPAVLVNQEYSAEIFLAAITDQAGTNEFNLTQNAGGSLEKDGDKAVFKLTPKSEGEFTFEGVIKVKTEEGDKDYPFTQTFQAFNARASIAATQMNMLYIGVDNPMTIAVPGVAPDKIFPSISGGSGSIQRGREGWVIKVNQPGNATVSVTAELSDGTKQSVGSMPFRVRRLPKPEAKWGTIENDGLPKPKAVVATQSRIYASMGESFAFEGVKFNVTRYQFIYQPKRGDARAQRVSGNNISPDIQGVIRSGKTGDRIIVDNIRATGPGGERPLNPIMIELQ